MPDILIRDIPDEDLVALDAKAAAIGLSRNEFLRRQLHKEAKLGTDRVTVADFKRFAEVFADLADETVMSGAWNRPD
jgi:hypothetical protein